MIFLDAQTKHGGKMTAEQHSIPGQNDKIMAALAHVSALLPFMGVIAPIVIWVTQRDKSEYVAFQALQAVVYQLLMILAWFVGMGCYILSFFSMFLGIPFAGANGEVDPSVAPLFALGFMIPFIIFGAIFIGGALFVIYDLIGAMQVFKAKTFDILLLASVLPIICKRITSKQKIIMAQAITFSAFLFTIYLLHQQTF
jgi:uncharacterized Tic20 family protein